MDNQPDRGTNTWIGSLSDIMEQSNVQIALMSIGEDIIEAAQRELGATRTVRGKKRRAVASGTLKAGLNFKFSYRYRNPVLTFGAKGKANDYLRFVIEGRRKGARQPPTEPILQWIKQKRIKLQKKGGGFIKETPTARMAAAFNIARSIGKKGIEPFPFYQNAIESVLDKRGDEIVEAFKKDIEFRLKLK